MPTLRRVGPIIIFLFVVGTLLYLKTPADTEKWRSRVADRIHAGGTSKDRPDKSGHDRWNKPDKKQGPPEMPEFVPGKGIPKPPGSKYTRVMVVPKVKNENIDWMAVEIPDIPKQVYVPDDQHAALHPPANKGHEAMVYLTYIIENYDNLPDIMLFMHNHRRAWHNNDILNYDSAEMVRRLSNEHVTRQGYMNLRCQWHPGCPDWMHPAETEFDIHKTEQTLIARAWAEIFPFKPVPDVLAQPCCSQFALSKQLVRSIPRSTFVYYRNWILTTQLKDFISGRVWEYMWQYAFTGESYWCPVEHICYCDGYGVCFGGKIPYSEWWLLKKERDKINNRLVKWREREKKIKTALAEGRESDAALIEKPEEGKDLEYKLQIRAIQVEMDSRRDAALQRGQDPKNRADEAGRMWNEGDGF